MSTDQQQRRLGPIKLSPGVSPGEVIRFIIIAMMMNSIVGFVALMQPVILTEILHVPRPQQGRLVGDMTFLQQLMVLIFVGFAGALADRWGRKAMMLVALIGFALSCVVFPLVSSIALLFLVRGFFGLAQNGHTAGMPVKMFDYPDNASRGKFQALIMIAFGLGSTFLLGIVWARMPEWLEAGGLSSVDAGRAAFWIVGAASLATALLCAFGLKRDRKAKTEVEAGAKRGGLRDFLKGFGEVFRYARSHPTFALLLMTGFIARTDSAVLGSFLSLWVVNAGQDQGLKTAEAIKIAGALGALQSAALMVVPFIMGPLLDRMSRLTVYCAAAIASGLALISVGLIHDVTTWPIYAISAVIGLTEAALLITQQSLFGQEAPAHLRGTAYGVFAFTGSVTVLIIVRVSGVLFDKVGYTAPFVLSGALHLTLLSLGGVLLFRSAWRRRKQAQA